MPSNLVTSAELVRLGLDQGLSAVGVCPVAPLEPARSVLSRRKARGLAGSMQFTYRNPSRSTDPDTALTGARSWVVAALRYPDLDGRAEIGPGPSGRIARYTWNDHYADLKQRLAVVARRLEEAGYRTAVVADANSLVDRNVAWRAGLGWYGKNTNLLLPGAGSWFVLGTVVTDAELETTGHPQPDGCGRCRSCIDECPTGAIVAPGVVDATACIAWLVQAADPIPIEYRQAVGDRLYGCDDCQTVCPPNRIDGRSVSVGSADGATTSIDVLDLLSWTDEQIEAWCGRWYIAGRDMDVVRRTALVIVGNTARPDRGDPSRTVAVIGRYLSHERPLLRSHAVWTARRLGLIGSAPDTDDPDPAVRSEWRHPVVARFDHGDWPEPDRTDR